MQFHKQIIIYQSKISLKINRSTISFSYKIVNSKPTKDTKIGNKEDKKYTMIRTNHKIKYIQNLKS